MLPTQQTFLSWCVSRISAFSILISCQLWENLGNWCSILKKKAQNYVREHYQWDSQTHCSMNANMAKTLLKCRTFLKHGQDEDVSTIHMCRSYQLTGPTRVIQTILPMLPLPVSLSTSSTLVQTWWAVSFLKYSKRRLVLHAAIVLAATAILQKKFFPAFVCTDTQHKQIKLVLDEVAAEEKEVMFKCNVYANMYIDILGLMIKCNTTPIHQAKTKPLHGQWAKIGK